MRPLSEATSRVAKQNFSRKYIALGRIVNAWSEIVGAELSQKAQPVKIHYRKEKRRGKPDATLDVATSSADATVLHYQKDLILERMNQIFGEKWITNIRFVTLPANQMPKKPQKRPAPLTPSEKKTLSGMLETISDPDIQARLGHLGQAILTESKR